MRSFGACRAIFVVDAAVVVERPRSGRSVASASPKCRARVLKIACFAGFVRSCPDLQLLNDSYENEFVNSTDEIVAANEIFVEHVAFSLVVMKIFDNIFVLLETNGCKSFEGPKIYLCTSLAPLEALRAKRTGGGAPRAESPCTAAPVWAFHHYSGGLGA